MPITLLADEAHTPSPKELGKRLAHARVLFAHLTQAEAADRADMSGPTLSKIEGGRAPSIEQLLALCGIYGLDVSTILLPEAAWNRYCAYQKSAASGIPVENDHEREQREAFEEHQYLESLEDEREQELNGEAEFWHMHELRDKLVAADLSELNVGELAQRIREANSCVITDMPHLPRRDIFRTMSMLLRMVAKGEASAEERLALAEGMCIMLSQLPDGESLLWLPIALAQSPADLGETLVHLMDWTASGDAQSSLFPVMLPYATSKLRGSTGDVAFERGILWLALLLADSQLNEGLVRARHEQEVQDSLDAAWKRWLAQLQAALEPNGDRSKLLGMLGLAEGGIGERYVQAAATLVEVQPALLSGSPAPACDSMRRDDAGQRWASITLPANPVIALLLTDEMHRSKGSMFFEPGETGAPMLVNAEMLLDEEEVKLASEPWIASPISYSAIAGGITQVQARASEWANRWGN